MPWGCVDLRVYSLAPLSASPPPSLSPSLSSLPASLPSSAHQSVCLFFFLSLSLLCWLRCDGSGFCSTMSP